MNTPAHLIFAAAAFARPADWPEPPGETGRRNLAALAGGLTPDLSVYLLVAWAHWGLGRPLRQVFEHDYRSPLWQGIFAVDNAIPLWAALAAAGLWARRPRLAVFAGAGLLHLAFDLPLHNSDARAHFQPFTDWVFRSPLSYWNPERFGTQVALAETAACLLLAALLWRRFRGAPARALIAAGLAAQLAPALIRPWLLA